MGEWQSGYGAVLIPTEAVEAALAANRAYPSQRSMDNAEKQMRAVLEAAAPFIEGQALRQAADQLEGRMIDPTDYAELQYVAGYADAIARLILMPEARPDP